MKRSGHGLLLFCFAALLLTKLGKEESQPSQGMLCQYLQTNPA